MAQGFSSLRPVCDYMPRYPVLRELYYHRNDPACLILYGLVHALVETQRSNTVVLPVPLLEDLLTVKPLRASYLHRQLEKLHFKILEPITRRRSVSLCPPRCLLHPGREGHRHLTVQLNERQIGEAKHACFVREKLRDLYELMTSEECRQIDPDYRPEEKEDYLPGEHRYVPTRWYLRQKQKRLVRLLRRVAYLHRRKGLLALPGEQEIYARLLPRIRRRLQQAGKPLRSSGSVFLLPLMEQMRAGLTPQEARLWACLRLNRTRKRNAAGLQPRDGYTAFNGNLPRLLTLQDWLRDWCAGGRVEPDETSSWLTALRRLQKRGVVEATVGEIPIDAFSLAAAQSDAGKRLGVAVYAAHGWTKHWIHLLRPAEEVPKESEADLLFARLKQLNEWSLAQGIPRMQWYARLPVSRKTYNGFLRRRRTPSREDRKKLQEFIDANKPF